MPTVPQYQRQSQTQTAPVMTTNLRMPENPLVQGIQQAAGTTVNLMVQEKRKADIANTQNGLLQISQFNDDQINNPQTGLITKQGKDALGQSDAIMSNAIKNAQDIAVTPILDQHGSPIRVSFADASKSGIVKPSTTGAVINWMGEKRKVTPPSEFYTPNVNATMSDAFRVIRGQDATSPLPQKEPDNPSNTLRDALNTRGGQ